MVKTKFKKAVSLMLAAVMSLTAFTGIGATTAFAAVGEKADVYLVDYPRSGDTNNNGEWGHGNLNYMNGWKGLSTKYTGLRAMGSYSGNIAYCIEPGTGQRTGDTLTEKDENFFNNISPNGTISGDDIRLLIGRILQYGYRGGISTSWKSQNESDANCIAHAYATQILIWETIVGERDAGFNHVSTSGYNAVLECVSTAHPLRSKILSYYTEEQRTYVVSSNNKAFIEGMGGYSIYASSLDGSDKCVRLEAYMADEHGGKDGWKIEKCYVKDDSNREMLDIIAGKFFIAYAPIESEKFLSMPKELARKYEEKFKYPERFYKSLDGIEAKPYKPVSKDMER